MKYLSVLGTIQLCNLGLEDITKRLKYISVQVRITREINKMVSYSHLSKIFIQHFAPACIIESTNKPLSAIYHRALG